MSSAPKGFLFVERKSDMAFWLHRSLLKYIKQEAPTELWLMFLFMILQTGNSYRSKLYLKRCVHTVVSRVRRKDAYSVTKRMAQKMPLLFLLRIIKYLLPKSHR